MVNSPDQSLLGNIKMIEANSQSVPQDFMSQQIAMAQLNDHILNEWQKNKRQYVKDDG